MHIERIPKFMFCLLFVFGAAASVPHYASAETFEIHVDPRSGRHGLEVALLNARDHRTKSPRDTIVINIGPGTLRVDRAIVLQMADSGSRSESPLVLRGASLGRTVISGAQPAVKLTDGYKEFDRYRASFNRVAKIVPRGAYVNVEESEFEAFRGETRLHPARWPKNGFSTDVEAKVPKHPNSPFTVNLTDSNAIPRAKGMWIGGFFSYDWSFETARVTDHGVGLAVGALKQPYRPRTSFRYFLFNNIQFLNAGNEYVLDEDQQTFYVERHGEGAPIEIAVSKAVFQIENASNIVLENLALEKTLGTVVEIANSNNVKLTRCFVRLSGKGGVTVINSSDVVIDDSVVMSTAETAITLSGGNRKTLVPGNNRVVSSVVKSFGEDSLTYRPGVKLEGVGNSVEKSYIFDGSHAAILFSGNDHFISGNEIADVVMSSDDAGAIYGGRDWTARGTVIEDNYIHDVGGRLLSNSQIAGVYLDDQLSGIVVRRNVFKKLSLGILIGGGRDNVIENNYGESNGRALIWFDRRGETTHVALQNELLDGLKKMPYSSEVWRTKYPSLATIKDDHPSSPLGNVFRENRAMGMPVILFSDLQARFYGFKKAQDNIVVTDRASDAPPIETGKYLCQNISKRWNLQCH